MGHVVLLLGCALAIYGACEWFVNAVEWLGLRLRIGPVAVGTVLAAAGTALPESLVTLVAVAFGSPERGDDIAVGAAMGGPLVVGTVAYGVVGIMLWWPGRPRQSLLNVRLGGRSGRPPQALAFDQVDVVRLARDQRWFLVIFLVKITLGLALFGVKPWLGLLFFLAYGAYFWREVRHDSGQVDEDDLEPLKLRPTDPAPSLVAIVSQAVVALLVVFGASQLFVIQLDWAAAALGVPAVTVALLVAPVATELPEVLNAVIWVRQGKVQLALANISGSMMIQATVPAGIGIAFTPWRFGAHLVLAGAATVVSVLYLNVLLRRGKISPGRLAVPLLFYLAFLASFLVKG
jgi:cation:H+ antiporter